MDLTLSESELAFEAEARAWLADHVPSRPLPSMDTAEGWARHQAWEAELAAARWSVVSWPREYHGREASLVEWVAFEEEYYRAGAPQRVAANRAPPVWWSSTCFRTESRPMRSTGGGGARCSDGRPTK